ncbi:Nn.00g076270.m01.CDS01 [Neocucurbitaria sp. VM-36]
MPTIMGHQGSGRATVLTSQQAREFFGDMFDSHQQTFTSADLDLLLPLIPSVQGPFHQHVNRSQDMQATSTYATITEGRQSPTLIIRQDDAHRRHSNVIHERDIVRPTLTDRQLVELRQARALASLDTRELDEEITRRVLDDPRAWGWVGTEMAARGWVDDMEIAQRSFRLEREEQLPQYLWTVHRRGHMH